MRHRGRVPPAPHLRLYKTGCGIILRRLFPVLKKSVAMGTISSRLHMARLSRQRAVEFGEGTGNSVVFGAPVGLPEGPAALVGLPLEPATQNRSFGVAWIEQQGHAGIVEGLLELGKRNAGI